MNNKDKLSQLTLEEKCALLSGQTTFSTRALPKRGIPSILCSDGPHGLRKQAGDADHLGIAGSLPATCFPTAAAIASSEDIRLKGEIGKTDSGAPLPYEPGTMEHYETAQIHDVSDTEFRLLLGRPIPEHAGSKLDRNITFGELNQGRSPIQWLVWLVLTFLKRNSEKKGKADLNLLFIYNMPLRALAKMTGGMVNMPMVDGVLTMCNRGFWPGIVQVIRAFVKKGEKK